MDSASLDAPGACGPHIKASQAAREDPMPAPQPAPPPVADFPSHYATPFAALATLLAGSLQRAAKSGASHAAVDLLQPPTQQQGPLLAVDDDAAGPSPQALRRSCGIPLHANTCAGSFGAAAGGGEDGEAGRWPDLAHAAMRLGSVALLLSKRRGQGASVAVLSCSAGPAGEGRLEAAVIDFDADGSHQLAPASKSGRSTAAANAAAAPAPSAGAEGWAAALAVIGARWRGGDEPSLRRQLDAMPEQGTRLLVGRLRSPHGVAELDWASDPSDLKFVPSPAGPSMDPAGSAGSQGLPAPQGLPPQPQPQQQQKGEEDAAAQRYTAYRRSLRAYMALLFLRWPPGFQLRLRGSAVQQERVRDWMRWPAREEYRPRGIRDEVDEHGFQMQHVVGVQLGLLREAPRTALQGVCVYHENRLVKPFWRVYSSSTAGGGVVGCLEADFLEPTPDWQDFKRTHVLFKLEAFLKRAVPAYWKRHAHLLAGGQAAGGAPPAPLAAAAAPKLGGWPSGLAPELHTAVAALQQQQQLQAQQQQLLAAASLLAQAQAAQAAQPGLAALLAAWQAPAPHMQVQGPAAQLLSLLAGSSPMLQAQLTVQAQQQAQQQANGPTAALAAALQGLLQQSQPAWPALQHAAPPQQQAPLLDLLARLGQPAAGMAPGGPFASAAPLTPASQHQLASAILGQQAGPAGAACAAAGQGMAATLLLQMLAGSQMPRQGSDTESAATRLHDGGAAAPRDEGAAKRARLT